MNQKLSTSWLLSACLFLGVSCQEVSDRNRFRRQTEVLEDFCLHKKDGQIYADPEDCRSYIFCSGGFGYRSKCASNLFYNPEVQTCDFDAGHCTSPGNRHTLNTVKSKLLSTKEDNSNEVVDDPLRTSITQSNGARTSQKPTFDIEEKQGKNETNRLENVKPNTDDICKGRPDGTYPHPDDCHSYVYCSNGLTFPAVCPDSLIYNHQLGGCDFDIEGTCKKAQIWNESSHLESHAQPSAYKQVPNSSEKGDVLKQVALMMPKMIEHAMTMLTERMQHEAEMAKHQTESSRPFKLVQVFLKAKPLAKQLSMPAFILNTALHDISMKYGNSLLDTSRQSLAELKSPLPPNLNRIQSDERFPRPDPNTCPWPNYNCRINKYRSWDGSCNNLQHPIWGRSFTPFKRYLPPAYADGMESFRESVKGGPLPNARLVSFTIAEDKDIPHHIQTVMLMQWGQFVDHDLTLTAISKLFTDPSGYGATEDIECGTDGCSTDIEACTPIFIPPNDPSFKTKKCLEFVRSQEVPSINCTLGARQQLNQITSYLDASNIYGSTKEDADALRDITNTNRGIMKFTKHPFSKKLKYLLPQTTEFKECKKFLGKHQCFKAGDERVNEQGALTVMHTLWLREHNRVEEKLHAINPHWDGETLYQETRRIIGAMVQHITYNEFLPVIIGPVQMRKHGLELISGGYYGGYNSSVDASIANVFASAAFRFGHTLIPHRIMRADTEYNTTVYPSLRLNEMFFQPKHLYNTDAGGIDGFVRGLCDQKTQSYDRFITKEVTKHLFSEMPPMGLGTDLVSLNIMRARDHGIPGYNAWRSWCGLRKASTFDDFIDTMDKDNINLLHQVYKHVDDVDLFPAGIAERPVEGGLIGTTFACIIGRQFRDLRSGDRYWYENNGANRFTPEQLEEIRKTTLAKVICTNADNIPAIQPSVMELPFREAYPDNLYSTFKEKSGMNEKWFSHLWLTHYNHRVNCSCLPEINLNNWHQS